MVRAVQVGAWRSPVSAPVWGTGGRGFKSRRPDQYLDGIRKLKISYGVTYGVNTQGPLSSGVIGAGQAA